MIILMMRTDGHHDTKVMIMMTTNGQTQEKREYWRQKFKENARLQKSRFRAIYKEECAGLTDDQFKKRYEEDLANAKKVDAKFEKVDAKSNA
mmetsp:Transcript_30720/g.49352  ORF Transcript_30720/g.49352 Transcript_30720/m.49352 type:complete len:92 (-) Transcript_30720:76-351(-)